MIGYQDLTVFTQNTPIFEICEKKFNISEPQFKDVNNLIAQISNFYNFHDDNFVNFKNTISKLSEAIRKKKQSLNFYVPGFAYQEIDKNNISEDFKNLVLQSTISSNLFASIECKNTKTSYFSLKGPHLPTSASERNNLITSSGMNNAEIAFNKRPAIINNKLNRSVSTVTYLTKDNGIANILSDYLQRFEKSYENRHYIHYYVGEGMEELEFIEATDNVKKLISEYSR